MQRIPRTHDCDCKDGVLKLRCHSCKCDCPAEQLVPCRSPGCKLFYCRRCLTSRYKYSKTKSANLPTMSWKCPVCCHRCYCETCISAGVSAPPEKVIYKPKSTVGTWYRKRRIRKSGQPRQRQCEPQMLCATSPFDLTPRTVSYREAATSKLDGTQISEQLTCTAPGQLPPITSKNLVKDGDMHSVH